MSDLNAFHQGSFVVFEPRSEAAREWLDENIERTGGVYCAETRYAEDILWGAQENGFAGSINGHECRLELK